MWVVVGDALWKQGGVAPVCYGLGQCIKALLIARTKRTCVVFPEVSWPIDRHGADRTHDETENWKTEEPVASAKDHSAWAAGENQHGIDKPVWVPGHKQCTPIAGEVFFSGYLDSTEEDPRGNADQA